MDARDEFVLVTWLILGKDVLYLLLVGGLSPSEKIRVRELG